MAVQKRQLSLDANFIFDLAAEADFAHDLLEAFHAKGYSLFLPPTASHELHVIFSLGDHDADRELARKALTHLKHWGIRPYDLGSTADAISEKFVRNLIHHRMIPEDEFNDGLILVETSLQQIPLLVTSGRHLLDIDDDVLLLAFNEADLLPVHPVRPKSLLRALR